MRFFKLGLIVALGFLNVPALAQTAAESKIDAASNIVFNVKGNPAIRFAPQDGLCTDKSAGAIRYNQTTHVFEGCNCISCNNASYISWSWSPLSDASRAWFDMKSVRDIFDGGTELWPDGEQIHWWHSKIYQNDTPFDIIVSVYLDFYGSADRIQAVVYKDAAYTQWNYVSEHADSYPGGATSSNIEFIVPTGAYYQIHSFSTPITPVVDGMGVPHTGGTFRSWRWMEFRATN